MATIDEFFVYIVESPSADDLLHRRLEGHALTRGLEISGIGSIRHTAVSKEAFLDALGERRLGMALQDLGEIPILHLGTHGTEDGIPLPDGEFVDWEELKELLLPLNALLRGGLIVCVSACRGFERLSRVLRKGGLPVFGLIGNAGAPPTGNEAVAFAAFYHRFLVKGADLHTAVEAMRAASGDEGYRAILAEEAKRDYLTAFRQGISAILSQVRRARGTKPAI